MNFLRLSTNIINLDQVLFIEIEEAANTKEIKELTVLFSHTGKSENRTRVVVDDPKDITKLLEHIQPDLKG